MHELRRDFLRLAGLGVATGAGALIATSADAKAQGGTVRPGEKTPLFFDVRTYGAVGDGKTIDSHAINAAIDAPEPPAAGRWFFQPECMPAIQFISRVSWRFTWNRAQPF